MAFRGFHPHPRDSSDTSTAVTDTALIERRALRSQGLYGSKRKLGRVGQLREKSSQCLVFADRTSRMLTKCRRKPDPTGAYRNCGVRGGRSQVGGHGDVPKATEPTLSRARPVSESTAQLYPVAPCGLEVT